MTLALEGVAVRYGSHLAVAPAQLSLAPGELIGLIGPNGAGKSSLLKAIAGVLPHDGTITWQGAPLASLSALARGRTVAYLPQAADTHWPVTAAEAVALGRMPHRGFGRPPSAEDEAAVRRALDACDATPFAARRVDRLSGGERARVMLARALAVHAPVLLVDEPIQSLDPFHQLTIMNVLREQANTGAVVVAVLHDIGLAARFCSRVVLLADGRIEVDDTPRNALTGLALERWYRIEPYLAQHDGEPVVVPWREHRRPG